MCHTDVPHSKPHRLCGFGAGRGLQTLPGAQALERRLGCGPGASLMEP